MFRSHKDHRQVVTRIQIQIVIELLIWIHISEHNRLMFYRRLPRFVIRCVGVVCVVMCIFLKCINIIQVLIICNCVYY
jgi:hypothetical protein